MAFLSFDNSSCTCLATWRLVSRSALSSSLERFLAVPVGVLELILTTHFPDGDLLTRICAFDASADFFACCSVDEVTGFGGRKALKAETETLFPPFFELTMFAP